LTASQKDYKYKTGMTISDRQMQSIGKYVKDHFAEWLSETTPIRPQYDPVLFERMVRVEEELKHQRELMIKGFESMEKRFEAVDRRFEIADKRFSELTHHIDQFMFWSLGIMISIAGIAVAVLKYL
jgi:hypothetical protein